MAIPGPSSPPPSLQRMGAAAPPVRSSKQTAVDLSAASQNRMKKVAINTARLRNVVERLELHFRGGVVLGLSELFNLVFSFARAIDYALSNDDIPEIAIHLPSIINKVYRCQNDALLKSAIMVLMISAKKACTNKWFPTQDVYELLSNANEISSSFCMPVSDVIIGNGQDIISKIMLRFYPRLKFCRSILSFEAKPGYEVLMADFHIQRNITLNEMICLLVAQMDNFETSSCLISPQHVSFLINGKGVEKRTNILMDKGPQFPTDITKMLKYGTNIIQAIGYFSGNYVIAIAFMRKIATPCVPRLEDYVHPMIISDPEIVEGPSTITLNCPISFKRIKTPVKGHLCKHHQCFDYDNFLEMNTQKPSWCCPCCNQSISCLDLRIDQKMAKILEEAGDGVADIVVFADGSWKVISEHSRSITEIKQETSMVNQKGIFADIVDLTMVEDCISDTSRRPEIVPSYRPKDRFGSVNCAFEDRKPFREGLPVLLYSSGYSVASTSMCTQAISHHTENCTWPMNFSSNSLSVTATSSATNFDALGTLESIVPTAVLNPFQRNAVYPAVHQEGPTSFDLPQAPMNFQQAPQSQVTQFTENSQLQPFHVRGLNTTNEAGRPPLPRHVSKTLIAKQASPAQTQAPSSFQRTQIASDNELLRTCNSVLESVQLHSLSQEHHGNSLLLQAVNLPAQKETSTRAPQGELRRMGAYNATVNPLSEYQPSHQQLSIIRRHITCPSSASHPSLTASSQVRQAPDNPEYACAIRKNVQSSAQHAAQATTLQPGLARIPSSLHTFADTGGPLPSSVSDVSYGFPYNEQNWRPTGRMRGSLTGSAYQAAINQYIATQSAQHQVPLFSASASPAGSIPTSAANTNLGLPVSRS